MKGEGERVGTIGHNRSRADCRPRPSSSFSLSLSIPFYAGHIAPAESRKGDFQFYAVAFTVSQFRLNKTPRLFRCGNVYKWFFLPRVL